MKSIHIILVTFALSICAQVHAQTLKNIHRHYQPVLRIPTHLIDKVETADVQGAPHLRVIQFNGYVSEIPLLQIDSITHSEGQALDPAQLGNFRTASVMGIVRGPTGAPEMNAIVRSPYGGEETRTDPNGVFFLNNIVVYDKLGYITITKPGFHKASRSFLPLESGSNRVNVQLIPMMQSGSFSASSGGTITSGLLQLNFPANAIQLNGQPFNGTVRVFAAALDPTSTEMFDQMPGELLGGMNDSLRLLRSFGMAAVELRDANMNELQLDTNVAVAMTFNIPASLQAEAPATIDWWSFDETQGIWMHEGVAQKQGNQYVGQASHFSWWNVDVPENFNDLHGSVNTSDGNPVSNAQVNVVTPSLGTGITYTNAEGVFSGRVPKNQQLTLNIFLTCESTNDWALAHSEAINSQTQALSSAITASLNGRYPISGTVVNCENQPVASGYVKMGPQVFLTRESGEFTIETCQTGEYTFRGFNTSNPDSIKVSEMVTVTVGSTGTDAGVLSTCNTMFGAVTDIDGNTYATVLIGDQWWMAENLKTGHFADGSEIPNVTDVEVWLELTTPAWRIYQNNVVNEEIYGKLYNWFTASDIRNVCPAGWHASSYDDWAILINYLGGHALTGPKIKANNYWSSTCSISTNESGFNALPGGRYTVIDVELGTNSNWWNSTSFSVESGGILSLNENCSFGIGNGSKSGGRSIRCVKN